MRVNVRGVSGERYDHVEELVNEFKNELESSQEGRADLESRVPITTLCFSLCNHLKIYGVCVCVCVSVSTVRWREAVIYCGLI